MTTKQAERLPVGALLRLKEKYFENEWLARYAQILETFSDTQDYVRIAFWQSENMSDEFEYGADKWVVETIPVEIKWCRHYTRVA